MRKIGIGAVAAGCLLASALDVRAAGAHPSLGAVAPPSGCKTVHFTGAGGYFDQGQFFWDSGTVTVTTHWCYSGDEITQSSLSYTTTIPPQHELNLHLDATPLHGGRVVQISASGDYLTSIINNVGQISLVGVVTATGNHKFGDYSGAGG